MAPVKPWSNMSKQDKKKFNDSLNDIIEGSNSTSLKLLGELVRILIKSTEAQDEMIDKITQEIANLQDFRGEFNAMKGLMEKLVPRFDAMEAKLVVIDDLNKNVKSLQDKQKDSAEKLSQTCKLIKLENQRNTVENDRQVTPMNMTDSVVTSAFDTLFRKNNVPHLLEKIFFSLDYDSFMACRMVNKDWNKLLSSERYVEESHKMLLEKKKNEEKLCEYSGNGNVVGVRQLLSSGVNPNYQKYDKFDWIQTPIFLAAKSGFAEVIKQLLQAGADPNSYVLLPDGKGSFS